MTSPLSMTPPGGQDLRAGRFVGATHLYDVQVFFEDTDLAGIVYHANYLRFMERARSAMLRAVGIDQRAAWENGTGVYAVTNVTLDYRRPAKLDDLLTVHSRLLDVRAAASIIHQQIRRGDDVVTDGTVTAAFISPAGRPRRQPADWVERFHSVLAKEPA